MHACVRLHDPLVTNFPQLGERGQGHTTLRADPADPHAAGERGGDGGLLGEPLSILGVPEMATEVARDVVLEHFGGRR